MSLFVLDQRKRPAMPCCEKRARLLERGHRRDPFTIRTDGYCYARQPALPPRPEERGFQRGRL